MSSAAAERREAAAVRTLAHTLFHRSDARGEAPDLGTARRLVDERLAPGAERRERVAAEALRLALAGLAQRSRGGRLAGRMRSGLRAAVPRRDGSARSVWIPTVVHHPDDSLSVVAFAPDGDDTATRRARSAGYAARMLFGRRVRAVVVHPDGRVRELPSGRHPTRPRWRRSKR